METGTRFLPINSKSKICCSVFNCNSKAKTNPELSFHHFPEAGKIKVKYMNKFGQYELIDRRLLWIRVLKMGKKVTKTMRVCSLHFVAEDYTISPDSQAGARSLKKSSIPSVNLPQSSIKSSISYTTITQITARKSRLENRIKKGLIRLEEKKEAVNCDCFLNKDEILIEEENQMEQNSNNVNVFVDFGVQVTSGDLLLDKSFLSLLKTDTELSTATGIETFELLNSIITAVEIAAPHLKIHNSILNISERVLLTFIKLKQNVSYSFLSLLFPRVNVRYCKEIICNMLDILFEILNPCIHYPSRNEILKNIPLCFAGFADTQIILDCTEIEIQKPKNLCCQITTYSNYKGRYTVKFMTGVTPGGIISFVSSAYGGRASDKAIFEQSKLLQQLEKGVSIMVDKGFLIDNLCFNNNIKLIRPSFLRDKNQFLENEAVQNADIASARVHVERLNQRLKVFQILGSKMSMCLMPMCQKIIVIICAIINLSSPIFKDDKFHCN